MTDQTPNHYYQAIGTLEGILDIAGHPPTFTTGAGTFPVIVGKSARRCHQPGEVQRFTVYPGMKGDQFILKLLCLSKSPPRNIIIKGCWEEYNGQPRFIIYRNELKGPTDRLFYVVVPVIWDNAPPTDGQFWEAEAEICNGELVITKAEGPFPPPPKAKRFRPGQKSPRRIQSDPNYQPLPPLTPDEIRAMATPVKIQVVCKLNQVPAHRILPDKRIQFFLKDGERVFTVCLKEKVFKKMTQSPYEQWVAAITGELGEATATGFELINPSLQIFEKKVKSESEASTGAEPGTGAGSGSGAESGSKSKSQPEPSAPAGSQAKSQSEPLAPEEGTPGKKAKKNLLSGIRLA